MGMDVYGKRGNYFRANVWTWHPIWDLCCHVASDVIPAEAQRDGHANFGTHVDARIAILLADKLDALDASGELAKICEAHDATREATPDETCNLCEGSGRRNVPPLSGAGSYPCNGCGGAPPNTPGSGKRRPISTWYYLKLDMLREFATFARESGGFNIH